MKRSTKGRKKRMEGAPKGSRSPFGTLKTDKLGSSKAGGRMTSGILATNSGQNFRDSGKTLLQKAMGKMARGGKY